MLKHRVMTAIVLMGVFMSSLFFAAPPVFCIFTSIIALLAAWEWTLLMGLKKIVYRIFYVILLAMAMLGLVLISLTTCLKVLFLTFFFWLFTIPLIAFYPRALFWKKSILCQAMMGLFVVIPSWVAVNLIFHVYGRIELLYLFVLVWSADIAAYFIGRRLGKRPLARYVSPSKTREGVYGGLMFAWLITLITLYWMEAPYQIWPYHLLLTFITILFSVVGDLFESMLKRTEGLKDSGKLLPGHGGILDRLDSLTAAAPIFTLGILSLSRMTT